MTLEEAIEWVESTLESKTGKQLTVPEKEILKAAWENETYNVVADSLYMSVGHIKDLASLLWKRLSDLLQEKVTKNNFRYLLLEQSVAAKNVPREIEKHQQTAEILYQSRALLASLLNSSRDGIAAMQAVRDLVTGEIEDFRYLLVNPVFAKILVKKREELTSNLGQKNLLNQLIPGFFEKLVQVVETGEALEQKFFWETDMQKKCYDLIAVKLGDGISMTVRELKDYREVHSHIQPTFRR